MKIRANNKFAGFIAMLAMASIAGCASTSPSGKQEAVPAKTSVAANSSSSISAAGKSMAETKSGPVITPAAGNNGTVVFFRERKFMGAAISFMVRENQTELGKLSSGTYFSVDLPAGSHQFVVHTEAKDTLNLEVAPGQVYYVQGTISMGAFVGHPHLEPSDATAFDEAKGKLKLSPPPKSKKE